MKRVDKFVLVVLVLILTAGTVFASSPYLMNPHWEVDPLANNPKEGGRGTWWRDTTWQNALASYSNAEYSGLVQTVYGGSSAPVSVHAYNALEGSNVVLICTATSYLVVGMGGSDMTAAAARAAFAGYANTSGCLGRTLAGLIYPDASEIHIWGAGAWTGDPSVPLYAPADWPSARVARSLAGATLRARADKARGVGLDWGADGFLGLGYANQYSAVPPQSVLVPNTLVSTEITVNIDDAAITLIPVTIGDSDPNLVVSVGLADGTLLITGDVFSKTFPNLGPVDGPARSAQKWLNALAALRNLQSIALVPLGSKATVGGANVATALQQQFDALKYVHDETMRRVNGGESIDDIAATLQLPAGLVSSLYTHPYAANVASAVRAIYTEYFGWFDGDPSELAAPLNDIETALLLRRVAGNTNSLLGTATEIELEAGTIVEAEKAIMLAKAVLALEPSPEATAVYVQALKKAALLSQGAQTRNYYLSLAKAAQAGQ